MNLLILGHNYTPEMTGIGPYTTELAEHFAAGGHAVTVLTTFPHYPRYQWQGKPAIVRRERLGGVAVRRIRAILPRRATAAWRIAFDSSVGLGCLLNAIGVARPDLIIAVVPTLQSGFAAGILAKMWRVPSLLLIKDLPIEAGLAVGMLSGGLVFRLGTAFERLVYRMVDRIVVIGEQFRGNLLAKDVKPELIAVIPDWVDLENIKPLPADRDVRAHLAGSEVGFLVLHAGTMAEKQGLQTVVEAAGELAHERAICTVLVGEGPTRARLEAAIKERHLENIRLLPLQPQKYFPKMLAAADALLLNQRAGVVDAVVPSKLLKYMAAGRPVVAAVSENSVAARLIVEAGCGIVVPPENPAHLAAAIQQLCSYPDLRRKLGQSGRSYAEAQFSKERILARWDQLLREMFNLKAAEP
jgi:colanic acid biosynthesis glycosyl transferase WcaI